MNTTPVLTPPTNKIEYETLAATLDELLDTVGDDENHPLSGLIDRIEDVIAAYDEAHYPINVVQCCLTTRLAQ